VFGPGSLPEEEQLMTYDQPIVRPDRQLDASVRGINPLDLANDRRRALDSLDLADVVGQAVLPEQGRELGHALAQVRVVLGGRFEDALEFPDPIVEFGVLELELVGLLLDGCLLTVKLYRKIA